MRLTTNEILDHSWIKDHTNDCDGKNTNFGFCVMKGYN
jgi:hypothetical protein